MKKILYALCIIILVAGFFNLISCKKDNTSTTSNQDKIYTVYELFFDANTDTTYARAWFTFNNIAGTQSELQSPGKVTFNGYELMFKNAFTYYEKQYAGKVSGGTFVWTDVNGNTKTNSITMDSLNFPFIINTNDTLYQNSAYQLFWVGDSLRANENVTLTVASQTNENSYQIFTQDNLNSKSVTLDTSQLHALPTGGIYLFMDRRYSLPLSQHTSAGGTITGRYRPVIRLIQLK